MIRVRPEDAEWMPGPGGWRNEPGLNPDDPPLRAWVPMCRCGHTMSQEGYPCQLWENDRYQVRATFLPRAHGTLFGREVVRLGISNSDQSARRDWREFMRIKRDVLGSEWEAIELYPAESRCVDPSNYFLLYAIRGEMPFGIQAEARLYGAADAIAPQRDFREGTAMADAANGAMQ